LDNVKFPLTIQHVPDNQATQRAMKQLETVGLADFAGRHPQQLSGGMQQRVGLARALAVNPDILLMDEPFGAIDAQTRTVMQEELMRIWAQSRKTVLFISHDLDEAVLVSDRIIVLSAGPGSTVQEIVPVDLPRPRWEYDVRAHPAYIEARSRIWALLRQNLTVRVGGSATTAGTGAESSRTPAP
jgi:ABC-type nitrate/sulfonate/bicarbonate transport system ATPase subunit